MKNFAKLFIAVWLQRSTACHSFRRYPKLTRLTWFEPSPFNSLNHSPQILQIQWFHPSVGDILGWWWSFLGDGHEASSDHPVASWGWTPTSPAFGIGASAHGTWCVSFLVWDPVVAAWPALCQDFQPYYALVFQNWLVQKDSKEGAPRNPRSLFWNLSANFNGLLAIWRRGIPNIPI